MNIQLLNRTFSIDPLSVIVRDNGVYAKVQLPGRNGQTFTHYVAVDRRLTGMVYDQPAEAPLYYTVPLPPGFVLEVEMPADLRGAINYTKGVKLIQPTLWVEGLKVA